MKKIYYDGSCPMCTLIIHKIDNSSQKEKFSPEDVLAVSLPENISKSDALKEIHVVDVDGKVYKNAEAVLKIMEVYPRYKFLVKIGRLWGIRWILKVGYNFVARNRYIISWFVKKS